MKLKGLENEINHFILRAKVKCRISIIERNLTNRMHEAVTEVAKDVGGKSENGTVNTWFDKEKKRKIAN